MIIVNRSVLMIIFNISVIMIIINIIAIIIITNFIVIVINLTILKATVIIITITIAINIFVFLFSQNFTAITKYRHSLYDIYIVSLPLLLSLSAFGCINKNVCITFTLQCKYFYLSLVICFFYYNL